MKKTFQHILFTTLAVLVSSTLSAESENSTYRAYIEQYKDIAIKHQQDYKIPAAITMAQGLLESGAGQSELAKKANNHFGIKCAGDWKGKTYTMDDDRKNECFRSYKKAEESWEDHAKFLQRDRYKVLYTYPINDYQAWANGLSKCGYATDPKYPGKLMHLIDLYHLDALGADVPAQKPIVEAPDTLLALDTLQTKEEMELEERAKMDEVKLFHNHRSGRTNGVQYIVANEGESFESIAYYLNMREKTLRKINDALDGKELHKGDHVFLYPKKAKASLKHKTYVVRDGDTAWSIAQKFGIKMKNIYRLNGIEEGIPLVTKQQLVLR